MLFPARCRAVAGFGVVSAFDQLFLVQGAPVLYNTFGDPGIVTPKSGMPPVAGTPIPMTVILSRQAQLILGGDQGQEMETPVHVMAPAALYPAPKRGDSIVVTAGETVGDFAVQSVVKREGGQWTLACHIVSVTRPGAKGAQQVR